MNWEKETEEIEIRKRLALDLGGKERVKRQHEFKKLTIRERILKISDPNTFMEIGQLTGDSEWAEGSLKKITPAPYVMGLSKIDGRDVAIGGEDSTVRGGSSAGLARRKGGQGGFVEDMAKEFRIPLVNLIDGAGANVGSALTTKYKRLPGKDGFERCVELLGLVPVASAVLGSAAGGPAGRAVLSHFTVMVKQSSHLFAAGPPVVERALSTKLSKEDLGGWEIAAAESGSVDNVANTESEALDQVKRFLSYLPQNVWDLAPFEKTNDPIERREEELLNLVPRNRLLSYSMKRIIELIVDVDSFFEIQPLYGIAAIVGFARIGGFPIGIIANNPKINAGAPDKRESNKIEHFVEICNEFNIPLVFLVDVPGFMIGKEAESMGTLRAGMRAMYVGIQAIVPRFTVIIRKCYGMAGALNYVNNRLCYRMAWPSAEFGSIPVEGGVAAAFKREIENSPDPMNRQRELEKQIISLSSPFRTAEFFAVEDIIDPRETRYRLARLIQASQSYLKTILGPKAKYGVRP